MIDNKSKASTTIGNTRTIDKKGVDLSCSIMGGAVSIDLTPEEQAQISVSMTQQMEYSKALNLSDAEIHDTLTVEYHKLIHKLRPEYQIPSFERTHIKRERDASAQFKAPSRRGSFDVSAQNKAPSRRGSFDIIAGQGQPSARSRRGSRDFSEGKPGYLAPTASLLERKEETSTEGQLRKPRRRSFDGSVKPLERNQNVLEDILSPLREKATVDGVKNGSMSTSKSQNLSPVKIENLPEPVVLADSWDSISQVPYCNVCNMAFKTMSLFDKHTKYSDTHTYNMRAKFGPSKAELAAAAEAKAEAAEEAKAKAEAEAKAKELANSMLPIPKNNDATGKQVEGTHYKLFYHGVKNFYKNKRNVEIHIYHHVLPHMLEVVAFDSVEHKELPRIYLDFIDLSDNVEMEVDEALDAKVHELSSDRFATIDRSTLRQDLLRNAITYFIMQRLKQIEVPIGTADAPEMLLSGVEFAKWEIDKRGALRVTPPSVLVPVHVIRRRASTGEEIATTISEIRADIDFATQKIARAAKIAALMHDTAEHLRNLPWYVLAMQRGQISKTQMRWIHAIRRVILGITKAKVVAFLQEKNIDFVVKLRR